MVNDRNGDDRLQPRADDDALLGADDAVVDRLGRAPARDLRALLDAIAELAVDGERVSWVPAALEARLVDGVEQVVITHGSPVYSSSVRRTISLLSQVGVIPAPGWTKDSSALQTVAMLERASPAGTARFLTAITRGERFGDGHIAAALADGRFVAALERLSVSAVSALDVTQPVEPDPAPTGNSGPSD